MPAPADTRRPRFRRTMLTAAAVSLLCFLWTIWMLVHFNGGNASFRFGAGTMIKIASIALPGPVLLAFVGWQSRFGPCRVIGWLSFLPVLFLCGALAVYSSVELRPPLAPGNYDAAVKDAETAMLDLLERDTAAVRRAKAVHESFRQRPGTRELCDELLTQAAVAREDLAKTNQELRRYTALMASQFDKHAVNSVRRDEYVRLTGIGAKMDAYVQTETASIAAVASLEERLRLLAKHWGAWHWQDSGAPLFDDPELNKVYDALVELARIGAP